MAVIGLSGPNAIGKTTALRRWAMRYPKLVAALADCQRETTGANWEAVMAAAPNVRNWKGTEEEKKELVQSHRTATHIAVIDSARTTALNSLLHGEYVVIVTCSPETMERNLRRRCEASGKRYREDYWDLKKLTYESSRRYLSFKERSSANVKVFTVNDYTEDWPAVDAYFHSLYSRLHN